MGQPEPKAFSHSVYFTLQEQTPEKRDQLVAACHQYLTQHPGTIHFSVGTRATDYNRPVNDLEFDVALVMVFASEADHQQYQVSERHQQFIGENQASWSQVRVFDAFAV